ncbi:MAG: radical SAM protein [Gemmatimonadota bacterium]|nr:radical SAM protein [Gemmatimonadota bacterium]
MYSPAYLELHRSGELEHRAARLAELARPCRLCPHRCGADRTDKDSLGLCRAPLEARVSSAFAHFGEEAPLVGRMGSGTIFFSGCNLRCRFCQNWEISHMAESGSRLSVEDLAELMLNLQRHGCHNINLVTPTHYVHAIVAALAIAAESGLGLPVVYNCGGYESLEVLGILEGVVDIYMPDVKFFDDETGARYLQAADYGTRCREALLAMHSQVGELKTTPQGTAYRGVLIRHLVMPGGLAGTGKWVRWIAGELSQGSYINVMAQYRPCHEAVGDPVIGRRPSRDELTAAVEEARSAGLRLDGD